MKVSVGPQQELVLEELVLEEIYSEEIYSGVLIKTRDGNAIGLCMENPGGRDDTVEFNVLPEGREESLWFRVNMQTLQVEPMDATPAPPVEDPDGGGSSCLGP